MASVSADPGPADDVAIAAGTTEDLARIWRGYSKKVYGPDYPLYQALSAAVAEDQDILSMVRASRPPAHDPNMLLAAIQYLVLCGTDHPLAALYSDASPPEPPMLTEVASLLSDFCIEHREEIISLMDSRHVQTNETGRCTGLAVGLAEVATRFGQPVNLVDVGASAGLNLALDEYRMDYGPAGGTGPPDSPVRLPCEVRGAPDFSAPVLPALARRVGIDRSPVDLSDEEAARWMLACIWPGTGRQDRAGAAIRLRAGRPLPVRRGDMVDDLEPVLEEVRPGPVVVVTSWSYSYLPPERRPRFLDVLLTESRRRPVAWLCLDLLGVEPIFTPVATPPAGEPTPSLIGLALIDEGRIEARPLAFVHSHGAWLRPLDEPYRPTG